MLSYDLRASVSSIFIRFLVSAFFFGVWCGICCINVHNLFESSVLKLLELCWQPGRPAAFRPMGAGNEAS